LRRSPCSGAAPAPSPRDSVLFRSLCQPYRISIRERNRQETAKPDHSTKGSGGLVWRRIRRKHVTRSTEKDCYRYRR
jgi:hypothetical protein